MKRYVAMLVILAAVSASGTMIRLGAIGDMNGMLFLNPYFVADAPDWGTRFAEVIVPTGDTRIEAVSVCATWGTFTGVSIRWWIIPRFPVYAGFGIEFVGRPAPFVEIAMSGFLLDIGIRMPFDPMESMTLFVAFAIPLEFGPWGRQESDAH